MALFPFKLFQFKKTPKSFLGIDIGTASIKVVELGKRGPAVKLDNYGEIKTVNVPKLSVGSALSDALSLSNKETARAIRAILKESGMQTREVNFAIPDFSSFFTSFELPPMSPKELEQAVKYEARSYIPLPLSEIALDWQIVEGGANHKKNVPLKILVAAIPNDVLEQYQEIASLAALQIKSFEAEVFALRRPLVKNSDKLTAVVDIGARSTTCNIFEGGLLKASHSFNVSGNELTEILSRSLKVDYDKAEDLKKEQGLLGITGAEQNVRDVLLPLIDAILAETKKTFRTFYQQEGKDVQRVVLAGGSALMPGLKEYFFEELKKETELANPFLGLSFPRILEDTLKEMGPSYVIAVGLALKGLD